MTNTGMRPSEAKNLKWRDIAVHTDNQDRKSVRVSVRGNGKHRVLVAPGSVDEYLGRIRAISTKTEPDDPIFITDEGNLSRTLYHGTIESLLLKSKLMLSTTGKRRSTYCFRHTYATFRLSEGVDVYFLAKQMATSVQMIEQHYGHVTPVKNAGQILMGLPGWESIANAPKELN